MGQQRHLRTVRHHRRLRADSHRTQPARVPIPDAQTVPDGGVPQEAHLHHSGHYHHYLCAHHGNPAGYAGAELLHHGQRPADRVCVAAGRHPDFAAAARGRRPDQECLLHLRAAGVHRVYRHLVPHHPHTQPAGEPHLPARAAGLHRLAMGGHPPTQQARAALRHVLHLHLAAGVHCVGGAFMDGLHAAQRSDSHLVDYAAHMHPHHYLRRTVRSPLRPQARSRRGSHYPQLALPAALGRTAARHGRALGDAQYLVGSRRVQPQRHLHGPLPP